MRFLRYLLLVVLILEFSVPEGFLHLTAHCIAHLGHTHTHEREAEEDEHSPRQHHRDCSVEHQHIVYVYWVGERLVDYDFSVPPHWRRGLIFCEGGAPFVFGYKYNFSAFIWQPPWA